VATTVLDDVNTAASEIDRVLNGKALYLFLRHWVS
jgi:hypothetical protein